MKLNQLLIESDIPYAEADIADSRLSVLKHELEKINKKATKLNTPPVVLTINKTFFKTIKNETGLDAKVKYHNVTVQGETPVIPGYEFLATIQHKDGGNVIRMIPGKNESEVKQFYNAKPDYCDHCKKVRKRIDTFIIRGKDGDLRQIGRNCLADFLGGRDPKSVLFQLSQGDLINKILGDIDDDDDNYGGGGGRRVESYYDVNTVLTVAAALIKDYGYVKADNYEESTSYGVKKLLFYFDGKKDSENLMRTYEKNKESVKDDVVNVLAWFTSIPDKVKEDNNYYHNIDVIIKSDNVTPRDVGILISIFAAYEREKNKDVDKVSKSNEWVGSPGDKLSPTKVKLVRTTLTANQFSYYGGDIQLCKFEDDKGNSYTWWNGSVNKLDEGEEYIITGKVKKHDEFKGRKTTVLTHVKASSP
jgi:hypothetical protein